MQSLSGRDEQENRNAGKRYGGYQHEYFVREPYRKDILSMDVFCHDPVEDLEGHHMGDDIEDEFILIGKGDDLVKQGRFREAIALYDRALRIDPENVLTWNLKGDALNKLDRFAEAVAAFDRALRIEPDHVYAWAHKGDSLYNLKRYNDALSAFNRALRSDPQNTFALAMKGMALSDLGNYTEALDCIEQALRIDPDAEPFKNAREYVLALIQNRDSR